MRLGFKAVYNFRPGLMKPRAWAEEPQRKYRVMLQLLPVMALFFRALTLNDVGKAMIRCVFPGAPKSVVEVPDTAALAKT
jgi:hypothetical protein